MTSAAVAASGAVRVPTATDLREITEQVWSSYLDPMGEAPLIESISPIAPNGTTSSVSVTGAWSGHVVVACSPGAARAVTAALLGMEPDETTGEDIADAMGELANVIGGNIKSLLDEPSQLSLPHVVTGDGGRWPDTAEECRLAAVWQGEEVLVRVLVQLPQKEEACES